MRILKKIIIGTFCFSLFASCITVNASADEQALTDVAQQLVEEAGNLDPDSEESVDKFAELLDNWNIETEEASGESNSLSGTMNDILQDYSGDNIQFIFAQLQQQQAQICKDQANRYLEEIEKYQDNQRKCADLINLLRKFQELIKVKISQPLPEDIKNLLIEMEICSADDAVMNKDVTEQEVELLLSYALNRQEAMANETQQQMVYLQDFIGQYNSYLQQAGNQSMSAEVDQESLSGGTMIGGSVGLLFTGILIGACAGIIIVLVVQKAGKKRA